METSENCAPQLFISVSNGTANSEDLSGRNMSSKIPSSQSHLLMKKKKKFSHPTSASALSRELFKQKKQFQKPLQCSSYPCQNCVAHFWLQDLVFFPVPGGLGKSSRRFPCHTPMEEIVGLGGYREWARESCVFVSAEQLNSLTLQMSHSDTIDWKGEFGGKYRNLLWNPDAVYELCFPRSNKQAPRAVIQAPWKKYYVPQMLSWLVGG